MLLLVTVLTAASAFQLVLGSEPYTGLTKRALPEDLPQALAIGPDGSLFVVATNNLRDGEPKQDTIGSYCAKLDQSGKLLWWSHIGTLDAVEVAAATKDGGLLLAGRPHLSEPTRGLVLYKYDTSGKLVWRRQDDPERICQGERCAMSNYAVEPFAMRRLQNDELRVLARLRLQKESVQGTVRRFEPVETDALIRYDAEGALLGAYFLDDLLPLNGPLSSPTLIANNGAVWGLIANKTTDAVELRRYDKEAKRLESLRLTAKGGTDWVTTTTPARDGGVLIAGWYRGANKGGPSSSMLRFSANGAPMWEWHGALPGHIGPAAQCADGSFIINIGQFEGAPVTLQRVNDDASFGWSKSIGNKRTSPQFMAAHEDGVVLFGYTKDFGAWYSDLYLLRTNAAGDLGKTPKR